MIPEEIKIFISDFFSKNFYIIIFSSICLLLAYASVIYFGSNNIFEIKLEEIIEAETGIKVDISKASN